MTNDLMQKAREAISESALKVGESIAADVPSRMTDIQRGFLANIIARALQSERSSREAEIEALRESRDEVIEIAQDQVTKLATAESTVSRLTKRLEEAAKVAAPDQSAGREVLLFASYCGDDNTACSDARPCPVCLGMSNVYRIPDDTPLQYERQLEPRWLANKRLERLTARQIGKAPAALTASKEPTDAALAADGRGE